MRRIATNQANRDQRRQPKLPRLELIEIIRPDTRSDHVIPLPSSRYISAETAPHFRAVRVARVAACA